MVGEIVNSTNSDIIILSIGYRSVLFFFFFHDPQKLKRRGQMSSLVQSSNTQSLVLVSWILSNNVWMLVLHEAQTIRYVYVCVCVGVGIARGHCCHLSGGQRSDNVITEI